jgi:DNA replication protein DnaC
MIKIYMIGLKECSKPPIKKIKFLCDVPIHSKLDDYELTKNSMNRPNTTAFIGRQGSGKTSLMINFVSSIYKKCFHKIYIFMRETSRNSLDKNIFDKYLKIIKGNENSKNKEESWSI